MEAARREDRLLTAEEYARLPDDDVPTELVRGRVVREPHPKYPHSKVQMVLGYLLGGHIRDRELPLVCLGPMGFVVERGPDTVRGPDIAVVRRGSATLPIGWFEGVPGLAVEIRSPSNRAGKIRQKVHEYLAAGAELVWIVDPLKRTVDVYRPDGTVRCLSGADRLDGGDVLPDLEIAADDLFADL